MSSIIKNKETLLIKTRRMIIGSRGTSKKAIEHRKQLNDMMVLNMPNDLTREYNITLLDTAGMLIERNENILANDFISNALANAGFTHRKG